MLKTKDIVFICDDNYCMPTAVCIQSIIDNIIDATGIIVHVCSFGLTSENVKTLQSLSTDKIKIEVNTFESEQYKKRLDSVSQRSHVTPSALIKFELANYFENLDSILYMDSDMVIKGDMLELLKLDIGDSYLAASYEFWKHIIRISYSLKRSVSSEFYFNSGVMLLNLKKMREDDIPEKLWDYKINRAKTTLMDQESLIAVCAEKAQHLPVKYNFNPFFLQSSYLHEINKVYKTKYKTINELMDDVCIIHYVGASDKPWKYKNALLRFYWDKEYKKLYPNQILDLKECDFTHRSKKDAIHEIIKEYGVYGLLCNVIYSISKKIKNV